MEIEIDKKGLIYAFELVLVAGIIAVSAHFAAREIVAFSVPVPADDILSVPLADAPDENAFYIEPPTASPVFLSAEDIAKKREALIWEGRDFLFVDIDRGMVMRYEAGVAQGEYPIPSSGGGEGFFEVPRGLFAIQGKAERHASQLGRRSFAWVTYLFGNYFIRATDGKPGGGITLHPSHARDIFVHAVEGMPALVSRRDTPEDIAFSYVRKNNLPHRVPEVTAAAALAADLQTGEALFEKNARDAYPTASLTKLMTAVVATEDMEPDALLTVTDEALAAYGDSGGLVRSETFRAADLLYGLILPSSNDAAAVYQLSLPDFLRRINAKANVLGMGRTSFEDASGLSGNNVTSANDLFALLRYINERHPDLLALSREPSVIRQSVNKKKQHVWTNVNWPRGDARYLGGKAGFTDDSLQTMAGVWSVRVSEYGGRKIAVILLGSRNRIRDVRAVIGYLEQDFVYGFAFEPGKQKGKPAEAQANIEQAIR